MEYWGETVDIEELVLKENSILLLLLCLYCIGVCNLDDGCRTVCNLLERLSQVVPYTTDAVRPRHIS